MAPELAAAANPGPGLSVRVGRTSPVKPRPRVPLQPLTPPSRGRWPNCSAAPTL